MHADDAFLDFPAVEAPSIECDGDFFDGTEFSFFFVIQFVRVIPFCIRNKTSSGISLRNICCNSENARDIDFLLI